MATIAGLLAGCERQASSSDSPRLDAEVLLAHCLGRARSYLYSHPEHELDSDTAARFAALWQRRLRGEPVAYLVGSREFWSLSIAVTPAVLIPRADTELLVEIALASLPDGDYTVVDLGTGSGAIALALAGERPRWRIIGIEREAAAAAVAEGNRQRLCAANAAVVRGDWCEALRDAGCDMIVANPPYIDPADPHLHNGDLRFEPAGALVAQSNGLADLEAIAQQARRCLKPGGRLLLEHGYTQGGEVAALLRHAGYSDVQTRRDLGDRPRVTLGRWHR